MATKKEANIVTPVGDFIANLVLELARRIVRNGEKINYLMEEVKERFPDITEQQTYTLLAELQKLGFDVSPNEWLFYTPIENRAEVLNKYIVKRGVSYSSRLEDINECIKYKKEKLKEIKSWLSENKDAERLSPQTFYRYKEMEKYYEDRLKELQNMIKLIKSSSVVYVRGSNVPYTFIGINEDGKIYGVLQNASGMIIKAEVDEISTKSDKEEFLDIDEKSNETGLSLIKEFEQLVKSGDPLKTFMNTFSRNTKPSTRKGFEEYIEDFLQHIDNEEEGYIESKTFTPDQINDAFKKIKEFVKQKKLNVDVDIYIDKSLDYKKEETEKIGPDKVEGMGSSTPESLPSKEESLPAANAPAIEEGVPKAAASKLDIKIADSLSFLNRIENMINEIKTANTFNRTAELDASLSDLSEKIKDIKFYIKEELKYAPAQEKEAAYVVLAHIVYDLNKIKKQYEGLNTEPTVAYIASMMLTNRIKKAKQLLNTIN